MGEKNLFVNPLPATVFKRLATQTNRVTVFGRESPARESSKAPPISRGHTAVEADCPARDSSKAPPFSRHFSNFLEC